MIGYKTYKTKERPVKKNKLEETVDQLKMNSFNGSFHW